MAVIFILLIRRGDGGYANHDPSSVVIQSYPDYSFSLWKPVYIVESHTLPGSTLNKKPLFYMIALLIPVGFLALIEGGLRLVGYGETIPLFIPSDQPGWLQPNPHIIQRYFHSTDAAPSVSPDTFLFQAEKPEQTLRLVLMGGSTAAGFPYGRFGSPAGMLQQRFKYLYPEHDIEVISVAMASINSYALRDFTDEVIAIQPDAVLVYAGHNEYLGIMGVGSVYASKGGHWANIAYLKLQNVRLFQLMQSLVSAFKDEAPTHRSQRTVMATVAKEKNIPMGSALYYAGLAQFESNLTAILSHFNDADVPVVVSTIAANEKDQAPFESYPIDNENQSADFAFAQAQLAFSRGNVAQAKRHFVRASDLDLLRFRAPSEFNHIIKRQADQHGAAVADSYALFSNEISHNIIDKTLMLEHLHPTARGYFLLANSFADAIEDAQILPDLPPRPVDLNTLWSDTPLTEVDHALAQYKVAQLTADYPFQTQPTGYTMPAPTSVFESLAQQRLNGENWLTQQQHLLALYQRQQRSDDAAKVAGLLFDALKNNRQAAIVASKLYLRSQQWPQAHYYARKAVELAPDDIAARLTYAEALFRNNRVSDSKQQLETVLARDPDNVNAKRYLNRLTSN
ncbi:tetratricopeptide repeat protein [Alteromonas oceanisediminis]|uniref:tetratricopeptide repeat protein n=1 Tax=Alteromonas oceanisediminis TaxID=2836180 RepID=UPI001BD9EFB9|nr:tetratricopeptide repeat protein [Alteromonas oceanisediminis]MBT0586460.1 tetratricopeptide repeat protein [Alteromonas oceanisediminis]